MQRIYLNDTVLKTESNGRTPFSMGFVCSRLKSFRTIITKCIPFGEIYSSKGKLADNRVELSYNF